jgi:tRNA(adenine34) deaminase
VIIKDGAVIGKAHNQTETLQDPTAHAEILAITKRHKLWKTGD